MKKIKTPEDIRSLGRILTVWAHPDDETFTSAGIIAAAAKNEQFTACVTFTKGEAGVQDAKRWPPDQLATIRTKELENGLKILGCPNHEILDFADGGLAEVAEERGVDLVKGFIEKYQPDTILTFDPEGMTGHTDHQTVSKWVSLAVESMNTKPVVFHAVELWSRYNAFMKELDDKFNIYFNIEHPPLKSEEECDIVFDLPKEICDKKCAAMRAMPSQTEKLMDHLGDRANEVFSTEAYVRA